MAFPTDGKVGVALTQTHDTAQFAVGTRVTTTDGGVYLYCKFTTAANQYDFVSIDENFEAAPLSTSNDDDANFFGVVQVAVTVNYYAWAPISGANIYGNFVGVTDISSSSPLAASPTAGQIMIYTTSTQLKIIGVVSVANASTTSGVGEFLLNFPNIVLT